MKKKSSQTKQPNGVSRREFGRSAAITLAGGALAATASPAPVLALDNLTHAAFSAQEQAASGLSAQTQAEVEAKLQHIFATYGSRLSEDQKKRLRRTVTNHVKMLEAIRSLSVDNNDAPATMLELITDADTRSSRKES
jgi:hypothetical protein